MAKYRDGLPFVVVEAAYSAFGVAIAMPILEGTVSWRAGAAVIMAIAFSFMFSRSRLKGLNLPLDCTWGGYWSAATPRANETWNTCTGQFRVQVGHAHDLIA